MVDWSEACSAPFWTCGLSFTHLLGPRRPWASWPGATPRPHGSPSTDLCWGRLCSGTRVVLSSAQHVHSCLRPPVAHGTTWLLVTRLGHHFSQIPFKQQMNPTLLDTHSGSHHFFPVSPLKWSHWSLALLFSKHQLDAIMSQVPPPPSLPWILLSPGHCGCEHLPVLLWLKLRTSFPGSHSFPASESIQMLSSPLGSPGDKPCPHRLPGCIHCTPTGLSHPGLRCPVSYIQSELTGLVSFRPHGAGMQALLEQNLSSLGE